MLPAAHVQRRLSIDRQPRLVEPPLAGEDAAGQHERLRLGPALGEAAVHQQLVEAGLGDGSARGVDRARQPAGFAPVRSCSARGAGTPCSA